MGKSIDKPIVSTETPQDEVSKWIRIIKTATSLIGGIVRLFRAQ